MQRPPIVVGVDGSPTSERALGWAAWLATATGRTVLPAAVPGPKTADRSPAAALAAVGNQSGADLVVVVATGSGQARRMPFGNVRQHFTQCPGRAVAVVSARCPDPAASDARPVLVGVDGSDGSARAVRWAAETARLAGCEVVAVHAFSTPLTDLTPRQRAGLLAEHRRRVVEEWCAPLRLRGVSYRVLIYDDDARTAIAHVARLTNPACVVVGSRGLGALSQRLLGSVTHHLVRFLDWPLVIVPSTLWCPTWRPYRRALCTTPVAEDPADPAPASAVVA